MRHTLALIVTAPNEEEGLNASSVVVVGKENTRKPGNVCRCVTLDDGVRKRRRLIWLVLSRGRDTIEDSGQG